MQRSLRVLAAVLTPFALAVGTWLVWETRLSTPAGERSPFGSVDLYSYFLPSYTYEAMRLAEGSLPLWNPYQAAGEPFLAAMVPGVLYPARLLLLVLSPARAMEMSLLAHLVLMVLTSYAFARALGTRRLAASGAAIFLGATYGGTWFYWPVHFEPGAWWPTIALALVNVVRGGGWRWTVLLGASGAMPVLAGGYQVTVYMAYALLPLLAGLLADARFRRLPWRSLVLRFGIAGLLAGATAAAQLLPTLAWSAEASRRPVALSESQINPYALPPLGERVRETLLAKKDAEQHYLSLPAIGLALFGFSRGRAVGWALGAGALLLYGVALGPGSPLYPLYQFLPLLALYRFPMRLLIAVCFLVSAGVALGLDACQRWRPSRPRLGSAAAAGALALLLAALLVPLENRWPLPWHRGGALLESLPLLSLAEAHVGDGRVAFFGHLGALSPRFAMLGGMPSVQNYEPLSSTRLEHYLHAVAGVSPPGNDATFPFLGNVRGANPLIAPRLLDLTATTVVVVTLPTLKPVLDGLRPVASLGASTVFVNPLALPRAYSVPRARFVDSEQAALAAIRAPDFDSRREAVLVGSPLDSAERALSTGGEGGLAAAHIVRDTVEEVEIDVAPTGPAALVLADAFAPGWEVRVDGRPRRLRQANYLVRGVALEAGDRRVTFVYRPPGWRLGWLVLVAGWLAAAMVIARARRTRSAA